MTGSRQEHGHGHVELQPGPKATPGGDAVLKGQETVAQDFGDALWPGENREE